MRTEILDDDLIKLRPASGTGRSRVLFWGETVTITGETTKGWVVPLKRRVWDPIKKRSETITEEFLLSKKARLRTTGLLTVKFIDVGQGDAAMITTPEGERVLVDGGEERHLTHYLKAAFANELENGPLALDGIIVTHGDADHFGGLTSLLEERRKGKPIVKVKHVVHNGLAKGPSSLADSDTFGTTATIDGNLHAAQLVDDIRNLPDDRLNLPFRAWRDALKAIGNVKVQRVQAHQDLPLLKELDVHVHGPIVDTTNGRATLPFFNTPGTKTPSASHTINGHSIILRFGLDNVHFFLGGDLNEEASSRLVKDARDRGLSLASEVFKVPHHGSADFDPGLFAAIRPVVSVVSSGDENTTKEYIHPRAGLVGALGKYSRPSVERPLVYVTEMVAFFKRLGYLSATNSAHLQARTTPKGPLRDLGEELPNTYQKTTFGIVHIRTDGERVLVATHSGKDDQKESYRFTVDNQGAITFTKPRSV